MEGSAGRGEYSIDRGNRKRAQEDKGQSLESGLKGEGDTGEILESNEESSSTSISLMFLGSWILI